jgi:hypothetical protein
MKQLTHSIQRPVFNYYSCVFVLYELSTPFLDIHLFLNQLGMAGSIWQLCNGVVLISVFFGARIVYGWYASYIWYMDIWNAIQHQNSGGIAKDKSFTAADGRSSTPSMGLEILPWWVITAFVVSNLTLNTLNVVWLNKMIATIRNRNRKPIETKDYK